METLGTPTFASVMGYKKWTDISHFFHLKQFDTEKIKLLFLHKVHRIPIKKTFEHLLEMLLMEACQVLNMDLMYFTQKLQGHRHKATKMDLILIL